MHPTRRRALFLLAGAAATLAACGTLGGPRDYAIPLARLQHNLERRFPLNQRVLGLFELRLAEPRLRSLANDRILLAMRVQAGSPLAHHSYTGSLSLSGRLIIDEARNAVVLSEARLEEFRVDGLGQRSEEQLSGAAMLLAERLLRDVPVYHYQPQDLRYMGTQYRPSAIRTEPDAISIRLEPARDGRL